jgi:hypothetical protein
MLMNPNQWGDLFYAHHFGFFFIKKLRIVVVYINHMFVWHMYFLIFGNLQGAHDMFTRVVNF